MEKVTVFPYKSVILLCVFSFYVELVLFDIFLVDDLMADGNKILANQTKEAMSAKVHRVWLKYSLLTNTFIL